jgi:hypothetical protein
MLCCTVVATLFIDILRGNDMLCWQHLTLIFRSFYLCPFHMPQFTPPLSLHSKTSDARNALLKNVSCSHERNLKLITMMNSALPQPAFFSRSLQFLNSLLWRCGTENVRILTVVLMEFWVLRDTTPCRFLRAHHILKVWNIRNNN